MFVGVNGTGKTTSIGKLAKRLKDEKNKVLLIAGDTFRAGAIDQLEIWGKRAGVDVFKKRQERPFKCDIRWTTFSKKEKYNCVLIDTAGRLHNKNI